MVNLYNASKEALIEMRNGNYHNIKLEIEHSPKGGTRWIFTKIPEGFISRTFDAVQTFCQTIVYDNNPNGPDSEFKFGDEIRQYHKEGESFHQGLRNAVKKASYLGKGLPEIRDAGFNGCVQESSYWSETFNPSHISKPILTNLQKGFQLTRQQTPDLDFETWMQTDHALDRLEWSEGSRNIADFQVAYLTPEQRAHHRVEFRKEGDDTVLYYQGAPLNTEHFETEAGIGRAIFVIGPDHQLYVGNHIPFKFHHTSFFGGSAVIGAGEIMTDPSGKLVAVTDKSGHYKPKKKHMVDALKVLSGEKGIDLTNITLIVVPKTGDMTGCGRFNAREFYASGGSIKPSPLLDSDYQ
ncbi:MAG: hypothetical protein JSR39_05595 [Verrucomicrobia bacterium]|nr:hypothetical protein [Verrucomicrobiota bacterium]